MWLYVLGTKSSQKNYFLTCTESSSDSLKRQAFIAESRVCGVQKESQAAICNQIES